ncbi:MAG: hypothetical protein HC918_10135 [Oscillatoriales cyanobacterium SM2_1_8]|nr:hypothetical protein [Oscillatoriales cyanobacterium SM2_1_8]
MTRSSRISIETVLGGGGVGAPPVGAASTSKKIALRPAVIANRANTSRTGALRSTRLETRSSVPKSTRKARTAKFSTAWAPTGGGAAGLTGAPTPTAEDAVAAGSGRICNTKTFPPSRWGSSRMVPTNGRS